jgi:putative transposase
LEDQTVPEIKPDFNPDKITGIDVGKEFLTTSCGFNRCYSSTLSQSSKRLRVIQNMCRAAKGVSPTKSGAKQTRVSAVRKSQTREKIHFKTTIGCYQNMT